MHLKFWFWTVAIKSNNNLMICVLSFMVLTNSFEEGNKHIIGAKLLKELE